MNFKLTKGSLNFKVYTSPTIPASGTENDIVIISSTPMENWILSSDSPTGEPRNNGDAWIQYSVSGDVFDIMNQHDFMLAITRIYQYISGIWMAVNARRYVGGVWDVVSSAFSASINITYPANSNCVVTNSGGQTVASDTNAGSSSKTWTATVGAIGTYTVTATATDGSGKSKSQNVSITADGQSVSVALSYQLILFDGGVVEPWTVINANPTATISDTIYLYAEGTTMVVSSVRTTNKIDVSGYSTLKYTVTENVVPNNSFMCVTSSTAAPINAGISNTVTSDVVTYGKPNGTGAYEVDLSEVTGSYYVSLAVGHYAGSGFRISKVWLE